MYAVKSWFVHPYQSLLYITLTRNADVCFVLAKIYLSGMYIAIRTCEAVVVINLFP